MLSNTLSGVIVSISYRIVMFGYYNSLLDKIVNKLVRILWERICDRINIGDTYIYTLDSIAQSKLTQSCTWKDSALCLLISGQIIDIYVRVSILL